MLASLLLSLSAAAPCTALDVEAPILLVTTGSDKGLFATRHTADRAIRRAVRVPFVDAAQTATALEREGGEERRASTFLEVSSLVARAEERFRELDTEEALSIIAKATARLAPIHQHRGAPELLAHAHFLAAAIYLARGRADASRQRMSRALDLHPDISPPRHRFAPQVLAELAAVRAAQSIREVGRLEVRLSQGDPTIATKVYLDGRPRGTTPLALDAVGVGRHLIRVAAPGYVSWVSTIAVQARRDVTLDVTLVRDDERRAIDRMAIDIANGADIGATLELIAKRAETKQVVVAKIDLARELDATGTATTAIAFITSGGGRAQSANLRANEIDLAFGRAARCESTTLDPTAVAPAILGAIDIAATSPGPVPDPTPIWDRPWFWALCAIATIGTTGAFVALRTSRGPPEAVRVRLIPRP